MRTDVQNMKEIADYLKTKPVCSVLFVLDARLRKVNFTLQRLMQIIIRKVHADDYGKLGVAINPYSFSETAKDVRADQDSKDEEEKQKAWVDLIIDALKGILWQLPCI